MTTRSFSFRSTLVALPALLFAVLAPGCAADTAADIEAGDTVSHDDGLVVAAGATWPKGVAIDVCWNRESSQTDAAKRNIVRTAVEQSWSRVSGVTFTGWGVCATTGAQGPNRISIHSRPGRARASIGKAGSNWIGIDLDAGALRATAIHEFGHSLGFYHEQADPRTPEWWKDNDGDLRANPSGLAAVSYWDAASIMNYCNPHWANGALSRVDILGARKYYGNGQFNVAGIDSAFADITGDKKADALVVNTDGVYVLTSDGTSFAGYRRITSGPFFGGLGTFFADVNGDGKADGIVVNHDGIGVVTSDGTNLTNFQRWSPGAFWGGRGTYFADVTGDGKADAIAANDDAVYVMPSTGTSFDGYRKLTAHAFYADREMFFADVNGDGKADGVVINDGQVGVMLSNWTDLVSYTPWFGRFYGTKGTSVADVTGDGKADVVAVNADNTYVIVSTGTSFGSYHAAGPGRFYGERGKYFADFSGDGKADGVAVGGQLWAQRSNGWGFGTAYPATPGTFYPLF